jgi:tetratricopeptide (TPR) repeat protein
VGDGSQPHLQPEAWLELAQLELSQGDSQAASNALIKAVATEPTHPSALQAARLAVRISKRNDNELQATQELLSALPNHPDRYQWRLLLGEHAFRQHQIQDALAMWRNIPTIAPESVEARRLAAEVILNIPRGKLSRPDESLQAVEALEESLQTHPEQRMTFLAKILRIRALLAIERRLEAARLAETLFAIEAVPKDLRPRAISAGLDAFRATNRDEEATRLLDSFARIDPEGNAQFSRHLLKRGAAHIRRLLGEGETEQANAEALRLLADAAIPANATIEAELPEDPWQAIEAAMVLRIAGEHRRALEIASAAMLIHPDASEVILEKAEALAAQGDPTASQEALVLFKRLRPGVQRSSRAWWICELRQLEILEQMEVNLHLISPRIKRLRLVDPNLGGAEIQRSFDSLQVRADHRALK